jgi:rRNA maturation protein Nop10
MSAPTCPHCGRPVSRHEPTLFCCQDAARAYRERERAEAIADLERRGYTVTPPPAASEPR